MRRALTRLASVVALALAAGCAAGTRGTSSSADRSLITREQILEHHFNTAYEAVESLHGNWLQTRGPDSFSSPSVVQVYLDNTRVGGVDQLKTISAKTIASIRYYDGIAATARWGLDHGAGVIFVSTHL